MDLAKAKGAKWNPTFKTWFVDDITKIPELTEWTNPYNIFLAMDIIKYLLYKRVHHLFI